MYNVEQAMAMSLWRNLNKYTGNEEKLAEIHQCSYPQYIIWNIKLAIDCLNKTISVGINAYI